MLSIVSLLSRALKVLSFGGVVIKIKQQAEIKVLDENL